MSATVDIISAPKSEDAQQLLALGSTVVTSSGIPAAAFLDPFHAEYSAPPVVLSQVFNPAALLNGDPAGWCSMLQALTPKLPVQLHCEPFNICDGPDPSAQPIFRNAVKMLQSFPELSELMQNHLPTGEPRRARIKFRLATSGEQQWLLISSAGGGADAMLDASTNDNWNGFRSKAHPTMLSVQEMHELAANVPEGVTAKLVTFRAGDVMAFDGRWWHATSYSTPVLNMFFTPGDDMEVAVKEHKRRMAMPMQKDLQLCKISMAKCSKLSAAWTAGADGSSIDWTSMDGHIALLPHQAKDAAAKPQPE